MNFNTALLHGNFEGDSSTGATLVPIYQTSAFYYHSAEQLEKVFNNKANGFAYSRLGNPTINSFEQRIAALENAAGAVACSSGSAAVGLAIMNLLESGDEIIAGSGLYGGTLDLFDDLKSFGVTVKYAENNSPETIKKLIGKNTKAVFVEVIGNPRLDITDIKAVSDTVHEYGIPLIADSTTATPCLVRPLDLGADIAVHSSSKYINGGGNSISGVIAVGGKFDWDYEKFPVLADYKKFGRLAYLARLRNGLWRNLGCCLAPANAFMNAVGLETMGIRMERECSNAKELAEFLSGFSGIEVNYPMLSGNPFKPLAESQFDGKGGAILTIRAGSKEKAYAILNNLKYALIASNIGDVRTLVIHPWSTLFAHSSPERRKAAGVYEDMIRISVGIEDIEDLKADFAQAIEKCTGGAGNGC